jgi:hypothetical protein
MYNSHQKRLIARELAHSGRNIPGALDALHRNYESFRTLSATTLRKLLQQDEFKCLLLEQQNNLAFAKGDTELQLEKANELAARLRETPLLKLMTRAADEAFSLAQREPSAKNLHVLLGFGKLLRSMEPKVDPLYCLENHK